MIRLRTLMLDDIDEEYVSWFSNNDGHLDYYTGSGRSFNRDILVEQFETSLIDKKNVFLLIETAEGKKIGNVRIGAIDRKNQTSDLVCIIGDRNFLGKGLATEAIKIASEKAFNDFGVHRLNGGMVASNVGSIKAYTRAGWSIEATMKDYYYVDGIRQDRICVCCIDPLNRNK